MPKEVVRRVVGRYDRVLMIGKVSSALKREVKHPRWMWSRTIGHTSCTG